MDKDTGSQGGHNSLDGSHKRSASIMSNGRRGSGALEDGPGSSPSEVPFFISTTFNLNSSTMQVEFDELMRSGTTMKVSLTPDRLRTFEVCYCDSGLYDLRTDCMH